MTETRDAVQRRVPWHFWLVCVVAVLWNGFGGYDYVMSMTQGDDYFRTMGMTEAQIAAYHAMPTWSVAAWAVGVWGSVAGALLLLVRSRYALHAFAASLVGLIVSLLYAYLLSNSGELAGQTGMLMYAVIFAGCVFFVWYARAATRWGILR